MTPLKHVGYQGDKINFNAVAYNSRLAAVVDGIVHGVRFSWSSSNPNVAAVDNTGAVTCQQPGLTWITATAGSSSARSPLLVRPGSRPLQTDDQWDSDQNGLNSDGTVAGTGGGLARLLEGFAPTAYAQSGGGDSGDVGSDEVWDDPRNLVGSPRNGMIEHTNIGNILPEASNFEVSIPILNSPGRGVPVNLSLNYNSRVWTKRQSSVVFNAINSWPYLGFTLSFGRIVSYGSDPSTKLILVDSDGTRHYLGSGVSTQVTTYQTSDGAHITYVGNATSGGTIYYTNGSSKTVTMVNNRLMVSALADTNGNYL